MAGQSLVRVGTAKDLDALVHLEKVGFTTDRFPREQLRYLLTHAHATVLIVEQRGRVCGAAIIAWRKKSSVARLYSIVIDPAFQGHGLGSKLLQACEHAALERGCDRLSLEVRADNSRAIAMYERHGYGMTEELRGYYADGANGLRMVKFLDHDGASIVRRTIPYYAQTLEFTCGPACLMMAMRYHDRTFPLDRALELRLWKEATSIFMTAGLGGCGPYGLAVAAQRRGYQTRVIVSNPQTPFLSSVRSAEKREVIRLVDAQLRDEAQTLGVIQDHRHFTIGDIIQAIRQDIVPIVLISTYRLHRVKAPHWVVVTGFDAAHVYFHDPYEGFYAGEARHVRTSLHDFQRMRRYGKDLDRSVLFIGRRRRGRKDQRD